MTTTPEEQYPRVKAFLQKTGMTLDQALVWTENELKKIEDQTREDHHV